MGSAIDGEDIGSRVGRCSRCSKTAPIRSRAT